MPGLRRIVLILLPIVLLAVLFYPPYGKIPAGVAVSGVSVGGLSLAQAEEKTLAFEREIHKPFTLKNPEVQSVILDPADFEVRVHRDEANEVLADMAEGNVIKRLVAAVRARLFGYNLAMPITYSEAALSRKIAELNTKVGKLPQNASVDPWSGTLKEEKPGFAVDEDGLSRVIAESLPDPGKRTVNFALIKVSPTLTLAELRELGVTTMLGRYETVFDLSNEARRENIRLSAEAVDGTLVSPGRSFSFNRTTGPRDREHGYQKAMVIVNGEFVPGYGGGVCQVSTTLYNAVLLAGLDITARRPHGRPVTYVPCGRDATVADGQVDFCFRNNSPGPVLIGTGVQGDRIAAAVFGSEKGDIEVQVVCSEPEVIRRGRVVEESDELASGREVVLEEGYDGLKVRVERIFTRNGRVIRRELISNDTYPARDDKVLVGTGAASG